MLVEGFMFLFCMTYRQRWRVPQSARRYRANALILAALFTVIAPQISAQKPSDPSGFGSATAPDSFTRVIGNEKQSENLMDEYERTERVEKRRTASDPSPLSTTCWRLFPIGVGFEKIAVGADGKAPKSEVYRSELEKLEKYLAWVAQDGEAQKEAYQKAERKRKERFELMEATHHAFLFTLEGKEMRGGRMLLRYRMEPNPAYRPTSRNTMLFTRVRGTLWIDEEASQLAKVDGSVTEDISIGLFLAKVYKGSHFMQERYEVAPGLWEPTFEQYDFDGRKYMVPFSIHERTFYFDYRRVGPPKEAVEVVRAELNKLQMAESAR